MRLPQPGNLVIGIAINRGGADFTERERELLDLLRVPVTRALGRLRRRRSAEQLVRALGSADHVPLTLREVEVLEYVALGRTDGAIAHALGISVRTVAKHLEHAYRKLAVSNRAAAVTRLVVPAGGDAVLLPPREYPVRRSGSRVVPAHHEARSAPAQ